MDGDFARQFAEEWIAAWNAHDLKRILAHYSEDFEMSSPVIRQLAGEPSGRLMGKAAIGAYWARALEHYPDLHFELLHVLTGADSLVLVYNGARGLSAEVFHLNKAGLVERAHAHYIAS